MHPRSLISLGSLLVLTACSQAPQNEQTAVPSPSNSGTAPVAVAQTFPKPVVSPAAMLPVPTVPGLITPTNARMRVPTIVTGRSDPFAAVSTAPLRIATATTKPAVALPSPLPATRQGQLPTFNPLPVAPAPVNLTPLPPALPQLPVSRTASADAIEISGVIKVGGKWSVIVKEPEAQTSRYVHAGAYLSNGQVLVKRIIANAGSDPIVILQQNGREITRTIGGSARLASK